VKNLIFAFAFLLLAAPCVATTIIVDANGTSDYPTIQAAIDAAVNGDTIIVQTVICYKKLRQIGKGRGYPLCSKSGYKCERRQLGLIGI